MLSGGEVVRFTGCRGLNSRTIGVVAQRSRLSPQWTTLQAIAR